MKKLDIKIAFFDADGTLWYPKKTKYGMPPWQVYDTMKPEDDPLPHLKLIPGVKTVLRSLKKKGVVTALISQVPLPMREANERLFNNTSKFGILDLFDMISASYLKKGRVHTNKKNLAIIRILAQMNIAKKNAVLIGDSYGNDYLAARRAGINCILLNGFKHQQGSKEYGRVRRKVRRISDALGLIELGNQ